MAQHDYVIDNSTGANVRADINSVLQAIATNNSGSSAPSATFASQFFADTSAGIMKLRNTSDNGFVNLFTLAGGIDVDAASNFNEDVTFTGASANIVFDKSDNCLEFADNAKAKFGSGDDTHIYHNGVHSYISHRGTGDLILEPKEGENGVVLKTDGAVELYYDNSKKFETISNGVQITGTLDVNGGGITLEDTAELQFGAGADLKIYHDGTNSYIDNSTSVFFIRNTLANAAIYSRSDELLLQSYTGNENYLVATLNGAVELYYDNSKKFQTTSVGCGVTGNLTFADNGKAIFGAGEDLKIFHESSSNDNIIDCATTRPLRIRFGGSNQFEFLSGGGIKMNDGRKIILGDSSDLQIFHSAGDSLITNATGDLEIRGAGAGVGNVLLRPKTGENGVIVKPDGAVELYFDNSKKFETTTNGVSVSSGSLRVESGSCFASNSGDAAATFDRTSSTGTLVELRFGGANKGTISVDGSNAAFNTSASDRTLKKNFESWNENVLDLFKNINPQKFNFIDQQDTDVKTKGFVAQDLVESFPEGYTKNKENKYMFNPSGMVVYLMKAIQELEAKVAALEAA